jgi:hypothetical protein
MLLMVTQRTLVCINLKGQRQVKNPLQGNPSTEILRLRSARAEFLEFYPNRPKEHLAQRSLIPKFIFNLLPVPDRRPTSFYSSPNEASFIYNIALTIVSLIHVSFNA